MHIATTFFDLLGAGLSSWNRPGDTVGLVPASEDPVIGAVTVIVALAHEQGVFDAVAEQCLRDALQPVAANPDHVEEAVTRGKWVASQCADANAALRHVAPFLRETLSAAEHSQFLAIAEAIIDPATGMAAHREQLLRSLIARLES